MRGISGVSRAGTGVALGCLGIRDGERDLVSLMPSLRGEGGAEAFTDKRLRRAVSVGLIVRAPRPLMRPDFRLSIEGGVSDLGFLGLVVALTLGCTCCSGRDRSGSVW